MHNESTMKHILASLAIAATVATGFIGTVGIPAIAQATTCTTIAVGTAYGAQNSAARNLQQFLVDTNYLRGGQQMVTGYFGPATLEALQYFQQAQGLPQSGLVDAQTANAIQTVSCGGSNQYNPYNPYNPTIPSNPIVPPCYYGCPVNPYGSPTISYLSPTSGAIGSTVTIYGSGFSSTGNSVRFGNGIIANLYSPTGTNLSFTVPSYMQGYGNQYTTPGTYNVSVTNQNNQSSNSATFTVTGYNGGGYNQPSIASVNGPTSVQVGNQGTWTVTVNVPTSSYLTASVNWGDYAYVGSTAPTNQSYSTGSQQTFTFTHAYQTSGTYTITFTISSQNGGSVQSSMQVTATTYGGGGTGAPIVTGISPTSGPIGTLVTIYGSGFNSYSGNDIRFGSGGTNNTPSLDGTTLKYVIPYWMSSCDLNNASSACTALATQVTPGTYQFSVLNPSTGQSSGTYNFTVTY